MEHKQMYCLAKDASETDVGICASSCTPLFPVKWIPLNILLVWKTGPCYPTLPLEGKMDVKVYKERGDLTNVHLIICLCITDAFKLELL